MLPFAMFVKSASVSSPDLGANKMPIAAPIKVPTPSAVIAFM
jgi:hypothetical protein